MASHRTIDGIPNIILIGVPSVHHLYSVMDKLEANRLQYVTWNEPDYDMGFTAIATVPLDVEQKAVLANYRLWKSVCVGSLEKEQPAPPNREAGRPMVEFHPDAPMIAGSSIGRAPAALKSGRRLDVRPIPGEPHSSMSIYRSSLKS